MHPLAVAAMPLFLWVVCTDILLLGALARPRGVPRGLSVRALAHRGTCMALLVLHVGAALLLQTRVLTVLPGSQHAVRWLQVVTVCMAAQGAGLQTLGALALFHDRKPPPVLRVGALAASLVASGAGLAALCLLDMRVRGSTAVRLTAALHAALFVGEALHVETLCPCRPRAPVTRTWR